MRSGKLPVCERRRSRSKKSSNLTEVIGIGEIISYMYIAYSIYSV